MLDQQNLEIDMSDDCFIDRIKTGINNVVSDFVQHPADYLFESDVQCALFSSLRDSFKDFTFVSKSSDLPNLFGDRLTIHPVKSEYPYHIDDHKCDRFDLAVLDSQQDSSRRIYHQHCKFGIEIKLWNGDGTGGNRGGINADMKKLRAYLESAKQQGKEFSGLVILFVLPGAEKRLTPSKRLTFSLQSSLPPTIDCNDVSLHVVVAETNGAMRWNKVPTPSDSEVE